MVEIWRYLSEYQNESGKSGICGLIGKNGFCGLYRFYGLCGNCGQKHKYYGGIMEVSCGMLRGIRGVYRRMDGGWLVVGGWEVGSYWLLVVGCLLVI
tara:strand:- start:9 stop:299 length:291 start_codon:yes stop_codon:yes gene_type:complete